MNYNISSKSTINSISSGISSGTSNGGAITSNRGLLGFNNSSNIGILLVIILSAILVAVKPDYFKYLFKTILGNLLLILVIKADTNIVLEFEKLIIKLYEKMIYLLISIIFK
jgi:hypothetical protein